MSFVLRLSPRSRIAGRFIGRVRDELIRSFIEARTERGLTQKQLADELGIDKSRVTRALKGEENLTLRTVAEFAWALDREIVFKLRKRSKQVTTKAAYGETQPIGSLEGWGSKMRTEVGSPKLQSAI